MLGNIGWLVGALVAGRTATWGAQTRSASAIWPICSEIE